MDINEFAKVIKDVFDDSDSIVMTPETEFRAIESFDSLTGWSIMSEIMDRFGVEIAVDEFAKFQTVKDIYDFVMDKKKS